VLVAALVVAQLLLVLLQKQVVARVRLMLDHAVAVALLVQVRRAVIAVAAQVVINRQQELAQTPPWHIDLV
jgi:hypothetical protein